MTTRRSPDGQVYTEVPVVPRHDQLDGRSLGNSHPIEAITGLRDELDGKVDAVEGKGLSTEDYTTEEKEKLDGVEEGAEANRVATVKVNGAALTPDEDRAVDVEVPSGYGTELVLGTSTLTMRKGDGTESAVEIGNPLTTASIVSQRTRQRLIFGRRTGPAVSLEIPCEDGAQKNVIESIRVDGTPVSPTGTGVNIRLDAVAKRISYDGSTGTLALKNGSLATLDAATLPRKGLASASFDDSSDRLTLTRDDGTSVQVDLSALDVGASAGSMIAVSDEGVISLTSEAQDIVTDAAAHIGTNALHVSTADRNKWNGVDNAVKVAGNQSIAGTKTFTGTVVVPTPTAASQAATKAYVDSVAGGGGGGGGTTYTAGTGLTLEGTEFSLDSSTQATLADVAGKADDDAVVKLTGNQSVAGVKTFTSLPKIPTTTPTDNAQAASKKYVDDTASGKAADTAVVHNTGAETVAGVKTFSSIPVIPTDTPTQNGQVASKAYVDAAVAGGGGSGTTYTAGTGLSLVGTEFSLDSTTQSTLSGSVQTSGAQTIAGIKTFSSSPVVPTPTASTDAATKGYADGLVTGLAQDSAVVHKTGAESVAGVKTFTDSPIVPTPTTDYQVATKKYVDDNAGGGGGGGGTWTTLQSTDWTSAKFDELFDTDGDMLSAKKEVEITVTYGTCILLCQTYPKGSVVPSIIQATCPYKQSSTSNAFMLAFELGLKDLLFLKTSGETGTRYAFNGVAISTSTAATVKATGASVPTSDVYHVTTATGSSGHVNIRIRYR